MGAATAPTEDVARDRFEMNATMLVRKLVIVFVGLSFACVPDIVRVQRGDRSLHGADLEGTNLQGVDLHGADLRDARLHANLHGADLHGANLQGADLHGANLGEADLSEADLRGAILDHADLRGANYEDANFEGASCVGVLLDHPFSSRGGQPRQAPTLPSSIDLPSRIREPQSGPSNTDVTRVEVTPAHPEHGPNPAPRSSIPDPPDEEMCRAARVAACVRLCEAGNTTGCVNACQMGNTDACARVCAANNVDECSHACSRGDAAACVSSARMAVRGRDQDWIRAAELYQEACGTQATSAICVQTRRERARAEREAQRQQAAQEREERHQEATQEREACVRQWQAVTRCEEANRAEERLQNSCESTPDGPGCQALERRQRRQEACEVVCNRRRDASHLRVDLGTISDDLGACHYQCLPRNLRCDDARDAAEACSERHSR